MWRNLRFMDRMFGFTKSRFTRFFIGSVLIATSMLETEWWISFCHNSEPRIIFYISLKRYSRTQSSTLLRYPYQIAIELCYRLKYGYLNALYRNDVLVGWGHLPSEAKASKHCNIHIFSWVKWNFKILFAIVSF